LGSEDPEVLADGAEAPGGGLGVFGDALAADD